MNITNLQHFAVFAAATALYLYRVPWWIILILAGVAIEVDQAISYTGWEWFCKADTWLDLAADAVGIGLVWIFKKYVEI